MFFSAVDALVYPFVLSAGAKAGVAVAVLVVCAAVFTPVGIFVAIQMYKEEKKKTRYVIVWPLYIYVDPSFSDRGRGVFGGERKRS